VTEGVRVIVRISVFVGLGRDVEVLVEVASAVKVGAEVTGSELF
jgi:hypothetical protein